MATTLMLNVLRTNAPAYGDPFLISGDTAHVLAGHPPEQPMRFANALRQEAGMASVMAGHADSDRFYALPFEGGWVCFDIEDAADVLNEGPAGPPLVMLTCSAGAYDEEEPSLGEALLALPGGPVTVIAASTESHPLTNYFTGLVGLRRMQGYHERIGDLWFDTQCEVLTISDPIMERILRDVEGSLEDPINVGKLRRDQVLMYALLGDPATTLRMPLPLGSSIERLDEGYRWRVQKPAGAERLVVSFRPRNDALFGPNPRPADPVEAWKAFERFNSALRYQPLQERTPEEPWQGTINGPGDLRLLVVTPEGLQVAVHKIE
jgi:hypothetical protein